MDRKQLDIAFALLTGAVLILGAGLTWEAYRQWGAVAGMGGHMGMEGAVVHGTHPLWYLLGTIVVALGVGVGYLAIRERLTPSPVDGSTHTAASKESDRVTDSDNELPTHDDRNGGVKERPRILDVLPQDERRILEPVITSPGITQIELRDRSGFSKSKVSQTVTALEKRGLLYREPQGRTFRVYASQEIDAADTPRGETDW